LLPVVVKRPARDIAHCAGRDLVDGRDQVKRDEAVSWRGLTFTDGVTKQSSIAYYVFSEWLANSVSQVNGVGEISLVAKNGINVNSTQRWVDVKNIFVAMYQGGYGLNSHAFYYADTTFFDDWRYGNCSDEISLLTFLNDNKDDYPGASLFRYETVNQLGL